MFQGGRGNEPPPLGIAFEGDFGRRIDAALAVALLNGLTAAGEARRISLGVSRPSLAAAQLADILATYYANRPGSATIGMPEGSAPEGDVPLAMLLSGSGGDAALPYSTGITSPIDTADSAVLIRNMLLAQQDQNAAVVVGGPLTGLVRLLRLYGAPPQIETKVRYLVLAVGAFPSGGPDPDVAADVTGARTLLDEWPTPVIAVGAEVGAALRFPGASIEASFGQSEPHPLADAYRAARPMPYDASATALAAVYYAAHPDAAGLGSSEPGTIRVEDDGRTTFTPAPDGRHRYLTVDPAAVDRLTARCVELVSAPPAPRPGRRGQPNAAVLPTAFSIRTERT